MEQFGLIFHRAQGRAVLFGQLQGFFKGQRGKGFLHRFCCRFFHCFRRCFLHGLGFFHGRDLRRKNLRTEETHGNSQRKDTFYFI